MIDNREHFRKRDEEIQSAIALIDAPRAYDKPLPIRDYILVKQNAAETTYFGTKFVIPDVAQKAPNMGIVVAVGPWIRGTDEKPADCKEGDIVTFGIFNAEPVSVDDEQFMLVRIHDVKLVESVTFAIHA